MHSAVAPAKKYSAGSETMRVDRALIIDLIRAATARHRLYIFLTDPFSKVDTFRRGDVKPVTIGIEIAAVTAGITGIWDFRFRIFDLILDPAV